MNLTAKTVADLDLPPGKADAIFFDDAVIGFGIRLRRGTDGGINRTWIAQYRHQGATRRLRIGNATVSAEMARKEAKKALAAAQLGQDPQADKLALREQQQFRTIVVEYLQGKKATLRPKTHREIERYLTDDYFRPLHTKALDAVTRGDVSLAIERISRESGSATAGKARSTLNAFFGWAMSMGLAKNNPCIGALKPPAAMSRDRVLSDAELVEVWQAADTMDAFGRIIKLLILTGQRRTEVGGMEWKELDFEAGTWMIPDTRTKNKRQHTITLPPMAWNIINAVPREPGREFVFGIQRGFNHWGWKRDLDGLLKNVAPWTLHDLRRTAATGMAGCGVQPHVVEAALNHQSGAKAGVAGIYNRAAYTAEVKAALASWSDHVRALIDSDHARGLCADVGTADGGEHKVLQFAPVAS